MVEKGKVAYYREKLDRSLASLDLTDEKKLETLVKDQILRSTEDTNKGLGFIDNVVAKRTAEVSNFLGMLRSASENYDVSSNTTHQPSWKLKQDTEDLRVMYREGPLGSPFHSLLAEGYVDAALDVCLCVSWESELYPRWFPETLIPTFKVSIAKRLQKVRIGEAISLVRMKLSWPLSNREAVLHYFVFEYFQDDLVLVLVNSISDVDKIQMETHGFTNEGIPDAENTVRMDVVGGFALQKVTENRSYFRTIANIDVKLDFVPPALINFISRQLIGSGFRLYQKIVASVAKGDESFAKALSDSHYCRIREALFLNSETQGNLEAQIIEEHKASNGEEQKVVMQDASRKDDADILSDYHVNNSLYESEQTINEIEEEEIKENKHIIPKKNLGNMFKVEDQKITSDGHVNGYLVQDNPASEIEEEVIEDTKEDGEPTDLLHSENLYKKVPVSPQVEQALATLDKMITVVKEGRFKALSRVKSIVGIEEDEVQCTNVEKHVKWADKEGASTEDLIKSITHAPKNDTAIGDLRSPGSDLHPQEPTYNLKSPIQIPQTPNSSRNSPSVSNSPVPASPMTGKVNGINENNPTQNKKTGQNKKWRLCCLHLISEKLVS